MNKIVSMNCLAIMFLFSISALALAQNVQRDVERLSNNIQRSVQAKEPGWRLVGNKTRKNHLIQGWKSGNDEMSVSLIFLTDEAATVDALKMAVHTISVGTPVKVDGIGDEAYIWENYDNKGRSTIIFRRGNRVVTINGTSQEATKRFALHTADSL